MRIKNAFCPKCEATKKDVSHRLYEYWHECRKCHHSFIAYCNPYRHGFQKVNGHYNG